MKGEKLFEAIGYMDEGFLEKNMEPVGPGRLRLLGGRTLRNLLAAVLAVTLLGCVVFANTVPAVQEPDWETYSEAEEMLDVLFGTRRYSVAEGMVRVRDVLIGKDDDGVAHYEEVQIPITSSASRDPVSEALAAMVEPYIIPVGKSVVDPTGTITMEVMAYIYEPETYCGYIYMRLTDPTGRFGGCVLEPPWVIVEPGEEVPDLPKGVDEIIGLFQREWGHPFPNGGWHYYLRPVTGLSDQTTWTFVAAFCADHENTVDMDLGFRTEPGVDYSPYRIDIDLERTPTMETVCFGNAGNREIVTLSPVSMRIDGSRISSYWSMASSVVIHFEDGSTYVVYDEEACIYGYGARSGDSYIFSNIIDIHQVKSVEIDGIQYVIVNW